MWSLSMDILYIVSKVTSQIHFHSSHFAFALCTHATKREKTVIMSVLSNEMNKQKCEIIYISEKSKTLFLIIYSVASSGIYTWERNIIGVQKIVL